MTPKIIFLFIFLFKISSLNEIDDLLKPRIDGNNIKYSMLINMKNYIENDGNLEKRELYESLDNLINKKIGVISGANYSEKEFTNVTVYNETFKLLDDLRKHKIDGAILDSGSGKYLQAFSDDIDILEERVGRYKIAFGFQKDEKYKDEFNDYLNYMKKNYMGTRKNDYGYDDEAAAFDLEGKNGIINVIFRVDAPLYAYKLNGDLYGTEVLTIYDFARKYGYKINLIESGSTPEQFESLKNKTSNMAGGIFQKLNQYEKDIDYSNVFRSSSYRMAFRYENTIWGNETGIIYSTLSDFDGKPLASLNDEYYQDLTKKNFPNSEIVTMESVYDIYTQLLLEDLKGCLLDKPFVDYFMNRYPGRISVYPRDFDTSNFGLVSKKKC